MKGGANVAEWLRSAALSSLDLHLHPLSVHGCWAEWGISLSLITFRPRRISSLCKHVDLGSPFSHTARPSKECDVDNVFWWANTGIGVHPRLGCTGKSLINSIPRILCQCHWVKLYLMALFWETRSMRLALQEHPSSPTQNTTSVFSRWASLPKTKLCQGTLPSICQKKISSNGWLLFMVSCYKVSLLMLAPGTNMHFHLTRSSPALSSGIVSIRLWPMFPKSHCTNRDPLRGVFFFFYTSIK